MNGLRWIEVPISSRHDRTTFDCGEPALNEFLAKHARQSHDRGVSKTFVAVLEDDSHSIVGFHSLCPASLEFARTPEILRKKLPRHDVPVYRLARLAVSVAFQGRGLGGQLLISACKRCLQASSEVGGVAFLIDAKTDRAANWYSSFGAIRLEDAPQSLVLPMDTIRKAIQAFKP